jgi:methyl-accepting chemotaxis protein
MMTTQRVAILASGLAGALGGLVTWGATSVLGSPWGGIAGALASAGLVVLWAIWAGGAATRAASRIGREVASLGALTRSMASGADDQGGTLTQTTTAVESLSDRIDRISQNAEEAAQAARATRLEARRGLEQVQDIIQGMERLQARVVENTRKARRLGERVEEIGSIVEIIGSVSSRTDMLALNATIESVRAGENGRGFAVIADEIRKLAERAAGATGEIGALVEAIQGDALESARALSEEQAEMEREAGRLREAGAGLERISQVAERSASLVEEISHSANDQVLATQELVFAMQKVSEASCRIREVTSQARREVQVLEDRCRQLSRAPGEQGVDAAEDRSEREPVRRSMAAAAL